MARSHVTKREAQAVCDFAANVMGALHMPGWQVLVMEDPADEDDLASISALDGKYTAQFWLASDWMRRTDDERRETVVHEVLHILHFRINHVLDDAAALLSERDREQLEKRYQRETELMVDHLAKFLSRTHSLEQAWVTAHAS